MLEERFVMEHVQTIGRYNVLHPLAIGESDVVYLAEDPILMRQVAIKVVRKGLVEERALTRFRRAAEVAGALKHPNIVSVLEVGEDPVAGPFVVMEFVDGPSLADLAELGHLDVEARLRWLLQIMRALEFAHASGIVHGNVNLGTVLVSRERVAKLVGFTPAVDRAAPASDGKILSITTAPELHRGAGASAAADRCTFSVMALELMNDDGMEPAPVERFVDLESFMRQLIDASALDVSVRAQLHRALSVRHDVAEKARAPSARRGPRSAGAHERAQVAPYQRALALAIVGMAAVAAVAVGVTALTSKGPEPASARKLYVISAPQGATIMVDAKRLGETPRRVFVDSEARRLRLEKKGYRPADFNLRGGQDDIRIAMQPLAAEPRRVARVRVATKKPLPAVATKKSLPAVLASPDKGLEPGGLFVVVGRGLNTVGDRFAGVGSTLRGWVTPEESRK